jgi:hypothetical protein
VRLDRERNSLAELKMTAEKLVRPARWSLRSGPYGIDVEGRPRGVPRYGELLYEARRFQLSEDLTVEVASLADIERYEHMRITGGPPEIRISRAARVEHA